MTYEAAKASLLTKRCVHWTHTKDEYRNTELFIRETELSRKNKLTCIYFSCFWTAYILSLSLRLIHAATVLFSFIKFWWSTALRYLLHLQLYSLVTKILWTLPIQLTVADGMISITIVVNVLSRVLSSTILAFVTYEQLVHTRNSVRYVHTSNNLFP